VSMYRAESKWVDDGYRDGAPAVREVWTIEGPAPFGGLVAESEEQAKACAERLNEASGTAPCTQQGRLACASQLLLDARTEHRAIMAHFDPFDHLATAEREFHVALLAEFEKLRCAVNEAGLGPVESRSFRQVEWPGEGLELPTRDQLEADLKASFEHKLASDRARRERAEPNPSGEFILSNGVSIRRGDAFEWAALTREDREAFAREYPAQGHDEETTAAIIEAVLRNAAERGARVRVWPALDIAGPREGIAIHYKDDTYNPFGVRLPSGTVVVWHVGVARGVDIRRAVRVEVLS
jgi:hypothetical protein